MLDNLQVTPEMLPFITAAIVQAGKGIFPALGFKNAKEWSPILSMAVGVGLAYAMALSNPIFAGVLIGLMASGGYSAIKIPSKLNNKKKE